MVEIVSAVTVLLASLVLLTAVLFSSRPRLSTRILHEQGRVDERDVIFARFDLNPFSERIREYYDRKPGYEKTDDSIRKLPDILSPEQMFRSPLYFSLAAAEFDFLEKQLSSVDGNVSDRLFEGSAEENRSLIDTALKYLGADVWGVCSLDQNYLYSHVGRGPVPYGQAIESSHRYAVVFAVEMNYEMIQAAPRPPVIVETARRYVQAADISIQLAFWLRRIGFSARAHIAGSNYQAMLVPLAWKAGLGELGRMGVLITPRFGPRVRLGLVTTEMPLTADEPIVFGVQDFCLKCRKCALNCPSQAIPLGERVVDNGSQRWIIKREECYRFWRKAGTDCAVCISVCPYSKKDNWIHGMIRELTKRSKAFQSMSVWGDDFFYGRRPVSRGGLPLFPGL